LNRDGHTAGLSAQEVSVYHVNNEKKLLAYHRWGKGGPGDSVVVVANFSTQPLQDYTIGFPTEGPWAVRFNSDSKGYDVEFTGIGSATVETVAPGQDGLPSRGTLNIAPYSAIVLSQDKT
jgi:1,4-alpha-glucan branching enzyme